MVFQHLHSGTSMPSGGVHPIALGRKRTLASVPESGPSRSSAMVRRSHGHLDSGRRSCRVRLLIPPTLEATMPDDAPRPAPAAIRTDLGAIFVSMELSRRTWLITSLSPGAGEKMSKHAVVAGDVAGLFAALRRAQAQGWRRGPGGTSRSSSSRRPVWTASGSTACSRARGSRATWSTPPRS